MRAKKLIATLCMALVFTTQGNVAYGKVIHEIVQEQMVTRGVTHIEKQVLTSSGWQDINILKIKLDDENVKLQVIEDKSLGKRETITNLATSHGAVAAINGDFFDMGASSAPGFGPVIEDGEVKHAYNNKYGSLGPKKHMATFIVDEAQKAKMDYYSVNLWMANDNKDLFEIGSYNKLMNNLNQSVIMDATYYSNNQAALNKYKEQGVYTILVEDNEIIYVSQLNELVQIPKGAMAVIVKPQIMGLYQEALQEGEELILQGGLVINGELIEDIQKLEMSVGGGGLIMKDGKAYTGEAHKVSGDKKEPRTIVATTYDDEVLLMTIDGRGKSIGANHQDLIQILKELQVKDAMYLDGGGSTTLSVRDEGTTTIKLQNKPSGGVERKVTNGIGVFSTSEAGDLEKILVNAARERTFVGEGLGIQIQGIDEYGNPITKFEDEIEINVAGVTGTWKGTTFYPESEGHALIMVTSGDVIGTVEVEVTKPRALFIEPTALQIDPNTTKQVQIYGVDHDGYKIPIDPSQVSWNSSSSTITANGNTITAKGAEVATLTASYKGMEGKLDVIVGESVVRLDSFEENGAKWAGTGTTVKGKVEPSKEVKYHGNQSLKMTYTFDKDNNRQIGYTVFNKPIEISADAKSVNMWLNGRGQGDTVKIQLEDAQGKVHYLKAVDKIDFTGWKYVSVPIPPEVTMPAKFTKLYVYTDTNQEKRTSALYIDHISMTKGIRKENGATARLDHTFDPMYKPTLQGPVNDQYVIKVTGPTLVNGMKLNDETKLAISKSLNANADMTIQASKSNLDIALNNPMTYKNQFGLVNHKDIDVMFVGTGAGSIRTNNEDGWELLKQGLSASEANHVVLVMGHNPLTQFDDAREGKALHDYLVAYKKETGKDIFVITTGGLTKEVRIDEGIRYIRLNGLQVPTDQVQEGEYLTFKVVGDEIYYTFEPMVK